MTTALLYDPVFAVHDAGARHPESPMRYTALVRALEEDRKTAVLPRLAPRPATLAELRYCHSQEYIELVRQRIQDGHRSLGFPDTNVGPGSWDAALHAAGGALTAVDTVLAGHAKSVFCVMRPPGHHARPRQGMGFCIFNNIALAARHAQVVHGLERILIVDWDVHHGNGTQEIFYNDPSVLFFSTHQSNWYPYSGEPHETGIDAGEGFTINCPFPYGTDIIPVRTAFLERLLPAARTFQPELVLISAGFDALASDPLGGFQLQPEDFAALSAIVLEIAEATAQGRVVSLLEGGYDLPGLTATALIHVHALMG
ncbi:histone deacetylase family protein [Desulfonatronum thioautotrophicum]|uniref:histone deacetylase family protein n=1 Tax=Desulfonatronum thioautotrophicum TaxID=617001 RepID=UPI0005EB1A49|nr:histone deacetylase [Desulfonatronum thioautotrophicum]